MLHLSGYGVFLFFGEVFCHTPEQGHGCDEMARLVREGVQAGALGFYDMIDSYEFAMTYLDRIARISLDDIKHVATKYLSKTAYVQATIEPIPRPDDRPRDGGSMITA